MATPTYSINGSITFHGVQSTWARVPKRKNSDGSIDYQPYALNFWEVSQAEMSSYLSLMAQSGHRLTSLETNDIDDANEAATYTSVELAVVNAQQIGRRAVGIRCEFRVDVS